MSKKASILKSKVQNTADGGLLQNFYSRRRESDETRNTFKIGRFYYLPTHSKLLDINKFAKHGYSSKQNHCNSSF